jgi:hypothetical protein
MTRGLAFLFIIISFPVILKAQYNIQRHCLSQGSQNSYLDPIVKENQKLIKSFLEDQLITGRNNGYIPLVFHQVLKADVEPYSEADILAQIEILNEAFGAQNKDLARLNPKFRSYVDYNGPQFCLAKKTEDGEVIKGIQYKTTAYDLFGESVNSAGSRNIKFETLGGFDAWDTQKYINIWIGELSFAQGEASFPNTTNAFETGIVIDPDYFGLHGKNSSHHPFHLGKTLVHEMGHYFNLKHIWGDEESCDTDDGIEDTPLQQYIYRGCPEENPFSCGSDDMYQNYMNFTNDECLIHFTKEQMDHMEAAIQVFYPALISNDLCYSPLPGPDPLQSVTFSYNRSANRLEFHAQNSVREKIDVSVLMMDGKKVYREVIYLESYEEINLNQLPTGIYILFLRTQNNFQSTKLFVY